MNPTAVKKAHFHFERACNALGPLSHIIEGDFTGDWADFLNAGNSVYEALGKGSKVSPQSRQWFGQKKRERRTDDLLNYMHQARNAAEHGLHPLLDLGPMERDRSAMDGIVDYKTEVDEDGLWALGSDKTGKPFRVQMGPPDHKLARVYDDRSDRWIDPPRTHLGSELRSNSPFPVSEIWKAYLKTMISEADALAFPTP